MTPILDKLFWTVDLYLSSALVLLLNIQPEYRYANGKILFGFPVDDALYRAMAQYNTGACLNVFEYAQTLRRLRSEMLMRKGMGQNQGHGQGGVYHAG